MTRQPKGSFATGGSRPTYDHPVEQAEWDEAEQERRRKLRERAQKVPSEVARRTEDRLRAKGLLP